GATACGHVRAVEPVCAVQPEVVLNGGGKPADADCGDDPRDAARVHKFESRDVLALVAGAVDRARPGPVDAAVVGDEGALLGAGDDCAAVVRINAHLADGVVLRELAGRLVVRGAEDVFAEHGPGSAGVGRLED